MEKENLISIISLKDFQSFPKDDIKNMILDLAGKNTQPKSIVMSISEKKKRPNRKASR